MGIFLQQLMGHLLLFKQRREEERLPVGKQDVGVPRDNSLLVAVPIL
jgi:hypothetical protein